ncbi:FG-GAP repeat domain-containing protein [Streptomyces vinaceus]|uniref:FG-GAP repeat domain-containing protein n=1 Tax=Streptomyces vinaceus TaxID=1960 RepID=UPI003684FA63
MPDQRSRHEHRQDERDLPGQGQRPRRPGSSGWRTFTVDHVAPPAPTVSSVQFPPPAWSVEYAGTKDQAIEVRGSGARAEDIREYQWSLNRPLFDEKATPTSGDLATLKLEVNTTGPNTLYIRTVSKAGNISPQTAYLFYVKPKAGQDGPGDVSGDQHPDILAIDKDGNLRSYAGDEKGDTDAYLPGAVDNDGPAPAGYWKDPATGKPALIAHSTDWYPGDGITDLVARMPDGKLYVYPGTGTGQFDISRRIEVLLPASAPDPATFRQIVATEDVTGDGLPDFFALDAAGGFWAFSGYTGSSFVSYKKMAANWAPRDVNGDGIPDVWSVDTLGNQWLFWGGTATLGPAAGRDEDGWNTFLTIG